MSAQQGIQVPYNYGGPCGRFNKARAMLPLQLVHRCNAYITPLSHLLGQPPNFQSQPQFYYLAKGPAHTKLPPPPHLHLYEMSSSYPKDALRRAPEFTKPVSSLSQFLSSSAWLRSASLLLPTAARDLFESNLSGLCCICFHNQIVNLAQKSGRCRSGGCHGGRGGEALNIKLLV